MTPPIQPDWYESATDPTLLYYWDGASWSPPVHSDDLDLPPNPLLKSTAKTRGELAQGRRGENQRIDWREHARTVTN